jgi:DNA-binding NarL/FixJ family response regulator
VRAEFLNAFFLILIMVFNLQKEKLGTLIENNIWYSFTEKQLISISNYYNVLFLLDQGFSNKEIHKKYNISLDCITNWKNNHRIPPAVKILEEFEIKYFRKYFDEDLLLLAYLVGYNLGDGNISKNFCNTWFYGVFQDLNKMKEIFSFFDVKPIVYNYKIDNGKMAVHDRLFSRLLFCFGAVSGDKTLSSFEVPEWILNSKKKLIKVRFLQGLFDSELCCLSQIRENSYSHLSFVNSKRIDLIDSGIKYLQQIKYLLSELEITSSAIKIDRTYFRGRDSAVMQEVYFYLHSNSINLDRFVSSVGHLYNSKRHFLVRIHSENLKKNSLNEKRALELYPKVLELRKIGYSAYKIAKLTNLSISKIKYWIYKKGKPRAFYFASNS